MGLFDNTTFSYLNFNYSIFFFIYTFFCPGDIDNLGAWYALRLSLPQLPTETTLRHTHTFNIDRTLVWDIKAVNETINCHVERSGLVDNREVF